MSTAHLFKECLLYFKVTRRFCERIPKILITITKEKNSIDSSVVVDKSFLVCVCIVTIYSG